MDDKWQFELEQSTIEEDDAKADHEFYETIEAPKFVDFTRPNHFCPDDRYWFCSRVGCNQKHEEGLDSETIYKDFVLRVMAARSPNVRFQRALLRKPPSDSKKCPMSAPPKSSKSRIPRLALVSSVSRKLMDNDEKDAVRPAPGNPASKPKARVKHVPAKYMTSPRKKKTFSPKLGTSQSVRSSCKTSITIQKNKVVAKALLFSSPKKVVKPKTTELTTPVTKLCEGVKKLALTSDKRGIARQPSVRKLLPPDAARKQPSSACNAKTRKECSSGVKNLEHGAKSSRSVKVKAKKHDKKHDGGEKHDGNLGNNDSRASEEKPAPLSERPLTAGSSNAISSTTPTVSVPDSEGQGSEQQMSVAVQEPDEMDQSKRNKSSITEDELENRNTGEDDKENVLNIKEVGSRNENILSKHSAPVKSKVKTIQKTQNGEKKSMKENCAAAITQEVKYKKLKTTNPKPFRLRTDERGILKEATLERKVNSHENSTSASENSQGTENDASATREKSGKKMEDRILKKVTFMSIKSKYKNRSKENAPVSQIDADPCNENTTRKTKSTLHEQVVLPQREMSSQVKPRGRLGVAEKPSTAMSKPKGSRQQSKEAEIPKYKAPVTRDAKIHISHKPKSCTRNIL